MSKEKMIEEMAVIIDKAKCRRDPQTCEVVDCKYERSAKASCISMGKATMLVNAGYGNIREFAKYCIDKGCSSDICDWMQEFLGGKDDD